MTTRVSSVLLGAGAVIQSVNTQSGALATGTTIIPADDTIPQITEGDEYMTRTVTPTSAGSTLVIDVVFFGSHSFAGTSLMTAALFQDSTANALACGMGIVPSANGQVGIKFTHTRTAGTTSPITFRVRAGSNGAGTTTFNGSAGGRYYGGAMSSSITVTEIAA